MIAQESQGAGFSGLSGFGVPVLCLSNPRTTFSIQCRGLQPLLLRFVSVCLQTGFQSYEELVVRSVAAKRQRKGVPSDDAAQSPFKTKHRLYIDIVIVKLYAS